MILNFEITEVPENRTSLGLFYGLDGTLSVESIACKELVFLHTSLLGLASSIKDWLETSNPHDFFYAVSDYEDSLYDEKTIMLAFLWKNDHYLFNSQFGEFENINFTVYNIREAFITYLTSLHKVLLKKYDINLDEII